MEDIANVKPPMIMEDITNVKLPMIMEDILVPLRGWGEEVRLPRA